MAPTPESAPREARRRPWYASTWIIVLASVVGILTWPPTVLIVVAVMAALSNPNPATGMFLGLVIIPALLVLLLIAGIAIAALVTLVAACKLSLPRTARLFGGSLAGVGIVGLLLAATVFRSAVVAQLRARSDCGQLFAGCQLEPGRAMEGAATDQGHPHHWRLLVPISGSFRVDLSGLSANYDLCVSPTSSDTTAACPGPVSRNSGTQDEVIDVAWAEAGEYQAAVTSRSPRVGDGDNGYRLSAEIPGAVSSASQAIQPLATYPVQEAWTSGLALSPDGQSVAWGSDHGTVQLTRLADGAPLSTFAASGTVRSVVFSHDGRNLAVGSDRTIQLWRIADGAPWVTLAGHTGDVLSLAFSPDGMTLVSGANDNTVRLWRTSDGAPMATLVRPKINPRDNDVVDSVAFSPDGRTLAASGDSTVLLWHIGDDAQLTPLDSLRSGGSVRTVVFSRNGQYLVSSRIDGTILLWRVADHVQLATLAGHGVPAKSAAFSPDGQTLAAAMQDGTVQFWRIPDGASLPMIIDRSAQVVAFSPDGHNLVSGGHALRVWALR